VAASALASLNALAPGRIDFGISTGFTARRTMGLGPVKLDDMREYIAIVQRLLAGETLEWTFEGQRRKIRFLSPEIGVVNVTDPIPLHISALGPRGRKLTAELGAGWIYATGHMGSAKSAAADMLGAWRAAGVDPATRVATAFTGGCVLGEGEAFDSPRARAHAGPHATIALHNLVELEQFGNMGRSIPPALAPLLERYRRIYQAYEPADARYLSNHRGHLMFLRPEEQEVCTADLIRTLTFTATRDELRERIRELGAAGYNHFSIHIRHGHPEMLEQWADVFQRV
jgi:5,10-methylenetetrahydromethanopterin reductase